MNTLFSHNHPTIKKHIHINTTQSKLDTCSVSTENGFKIQSINASLYQQKHQINLKKNHIHIVVSENENLYIYFINDIKKTQNQPYHCCYWIPLNKDQDEIIILMNDNDKPIYLISIHQLWLTKWDDLIEKKPDWWQTQKQKSILSFMGSRQLNQWIKDILTISVRRNIKIQALLSLLTMKIWYEIIEKMDGYQPFLLPKNSYKKLDKLIHLLHSGQADTWPLKEMALYCQSNTTSLQKHFQIIYKQTIWQYLRKLKLKRAYQALTTGISVAAAAEIAGYQHIESFSKAFKQQFGHNPSQL